MKIERSCTELQSELCVALDEEYILPNEFKDVYEHARRTGAAVRGFIPESCMKINEKRFIRLTTTGLQDF